MPGASAACARRACHIPAVRPRPQAVPCRLRRKRGLQARAHGAVRSDGHGSHAELRRGGAPRVGLLSVGVEESKGSHFIREVYDLLERLPIRFTGMMEARDALSGEYDVIVAEGFSGNVLLKTVEARPVHGRPAARQHRSRRPRRGRHHCRRAGLCLKRRVHAARPAKALPEGARQRKRRHDPKRRPPAPAAERAGLSRAPAGPARPHGRAAKDLKIQQKPGLPPRAFLPIGNAFGLSRRLDHSPLRARIIRRWQTIRTLAD